MIDFDDSASGDIISKDSSPLQACLAARASEDGVLASETGADGILAPFELASVSLPIGFLIMTSAGSMVFPSERRSRYFLGFEFRPEKSGKIFKLRNLLQ